MRLLLKMNQINFYRKIHHMWIGLFLENISALVFFFPAKTGSTSL